MNTRRCCDGDKVTAFGDIACFTDPANDPWPGARRTTGPLAHPYGDCERHDLLCDIEYLRAEVRHLKKALQSAIDERDMLRAANRIIAVTLQPRGRRATQKQAPSATGDGRSNPAR
ncbi:MAG TPA: hypothetical protein PL143_01410 [Rhodocyclaceae bacterium]|nr:hypothetical protein [Rhodocyclaceae bacterium]